MTITFDPVALLASLIIALIAIFVALWATK